MDPARGGSSGRLAAIIRRSFRQAQRLFHTLIGLAFLLLATAGALETVREWAVYRSAPSNGPVRLSLLAGFTVLLVILGLYTLAKARSIR